MVTWKNLAVAAAAAIGYAQAAPGSSQSRSSNNNNNIVKDNYIIRLRDDISDFEAHTSWVTGVHKRNMAKRGLNDVFKGIRREFNYKNVKVRGYSGEFDDATLEELRKSDAVLRIEPVYEVALDDIVVNETPRIAAKDQVPWHLAAISNRRINGTEYYHDPEIGVDTWAYMLDSGIRLTHSEFGGRAEYGYNAFEDDDGSDTIGHGSHVAGTMAGKTYGVTKKANIVSVKVFSELASTYDAVLEGIQWTIDDIVEKKRVGRAIINMSFASPKSDLFDELIQEALDKDIMSIAGAGNTKEDVANVSPASNPNTFTVGATQPDWNMWATDRLGTNFGEEIDIMAPGGDVTSAWFTDDDAFQTLSGTSTASPHVAGLALYAISEQDLKTPKEIKKFLLENGTPGVVGGDLRGSPNLLANNGNTKQQS